MGEDLPPMSVILFVVSYALRTSVLRVSLLQVTDALDELFNGLRFLVLESVTLST